MAVQPNNRSAYTSTLWNSAAKASHSVNAAKYGGPSVNISEGSKIQFSEGEAVWDVVRVFADGTLYLATVSSGSRITRKIPPTSPSWTNLWMVDGKRLRTPGATVAAPASPAGGGPNRNIDPGNVVTLGASDVRWSVYEVKRDGTIVVQTFNGERVVTAEVGPMSKLWNSIYTVNS